MTQELIANMLGVRREGVTEAAGNLQAAGLIQYSRGHIKVLDRASTGEARMRVLRGGEKGIRPLAAIQHPRPAGHKDVAATSKLATIAAD